MNLIEMLDSMLENGDLPEPSDIQNGKDAITQLQAENDDLNHRIDTWEEDYDDCVKMIEKDSARIVGLKEEIRQLKKALELALTFLDTDSPRFKEESKVWAKALK